MREKEMQTRFLWGNLKEGSHLEDICGSRRIILEWILEIGWVGVDQNYLAQHCKNGCASWSELSG